jgi:hypothetical protein
MDNASKELESLYKDIPSTCGCVENMGQCRAWCCRIQNPQVMKCEFLNTWQYIMHWWSVEDIVHLIEKAVRSYILNDPNKGCIFLDSDNGFCTQYETRSFNCRTYGITPKEEFTSRYLKLLEKYKDRSDIIIKDQCDLVNTEDGSEITLEQMEKWWKKLLDIEMSIGVLENQLHDRSGGTYRSYNDHLIMFLFPDVIVNQMTIIRVGKFTKEQKEECIISFIEALKSSLKSMIENLKYE